MRDSGLHPHMLYADGRADPSPWLRLDLAQWPRHLAIDPRPPVPLVGSGPSNHPQAAGPDILLEPGFTQEQVVRGIEHAPLASAVLVQLLRITEQLAPADALRAESMAYAMLQGGSEHEYWHRQRRITPARPAGKLHTNRNGACLEILVDRPNALNAIDRSLRDALFDALSLAAMDNTILDVHLHAAGRAFSVGADLAEFGITRDPAEAHAIRMRTLPAWPMMRCASKCHVHIQGACIGSGLELAAFARKVTATSDAWFQLPETGMGILPGFGGTVSIPKRIGRQRAALLMLSGKRISAKRALAWGLIDAIVDDLAPDQR